jgi:hypothetical protein
MPRSRRHVAQVLLTVAALAVVGRMALAIGVAADLIALVMPHAPPGFGRRDSGPPGWLVGSYG